MTLIEGLVFPLGVLNLNDWGVPLTEEETAITTAEGAKIRICSRIDPHFCDVIGDPTSEIGAVLNAWTEGEGADKSIYAKAEIKDSIAAQKIEDGVWGNSWSVFLNYQSIDSGGWVHGVQIESISLVDNPAWPAATWKIVSASNGQKKLVFKSNYKIIKNNTQQGGMMPKTNEELEAENKKLKEEIVKLKGSGGTPNDGTGDDGVEGPDGDGEAGGKDGEAGGKDGEEGPDGVNETGGEGGDDSTERDEGPGGSGGGEPAGMAALRYENATLKKKMATMVTTDAVKQMVSEAITNDHKAQAAKLETENAFKEFATVRASLGMETDPEQYKTFGASELKKFTEDLQGLKTQVETKGSGMVFQASSGAKGGSTVGRWDPKKKEYTNEKRV